MMQKLQHKHLYGNCVMLSPEGQTLCLCDQKKINWYLSRNLAVLERTDPPTIRLKFTPKGNGKADFPYYVSEKKNICVCCGGKTGLTKHHCIPHCFRRFFPRAYKSHNCHDIVLLCDECHIKYEIYANQLKHKLLTEYGISAILRIPDEDLHLIGIAKKANALVRYRDKMPLKRIKELEAVIKNHLGKEELTEEDVKAVQACDPRFCFPSEGDRFGKQLVDKISNIPEFIILWRKHFVDTMNPQHLPKFWDVEHDDLKGCGQLPENLEKSVNT